MAMDTVRQPKPAPLAIQVLHAERKLLERRRIVIACTTRLRSTAHAQMASPAMLLGAAGLGFALERLTRRKAEKPGASKQTRHADTDFFGLVLKLSSFVRTLSGFIA